MSFADSPQNPHRSSSRAKGSSGPTLIVGEHAKGLYVNVNWAVDWMTRCQTTTKNDDTDLRSLGTLKPRTTTLSRRILIPKTRSTLVLFLTAFTCLQLAPTRTGQLNNRVCKRDIRGNSTPKPGPFRVNRASKDVHRVYFLFGSGYSARQSHKHTPQHTNLQQEATALPLWGRVRTAFGSSCCSLPDQDLSFAHFERIYIYIILYNIYTHTHVLHVSTHGSKTTSRVFCSSSYQFFFLKTVIPMILGSGMNTSRQNSDAVFSKYESKGATPLSNIILTPEDFTQNPACSVPK